MNVLYTDAVKHWEAYSVLPAVTNMLQSIVKRFADEITAEWDLAKDERGQPVVCLRLSDSYGQVTAHLDPETWRYGNYLQLCLLGLWSELLAIRSDKHMEKLLEACNPAEAIDAP